MFQIQCAIYMLALKKSYCVNRFVLFQTTQLSSRLSVLINFSLPGSVKLFHPIYIWNSDFYLSSAKDCGVFSSLACFAMNMHQDESIEEHFPTFSQ